MLNLRHQIQPWHPQSTLTHEVAHFSRFFKKPDYLLGRRCCAQSWSFQVHSVLWCGLFIPRISTNDDVLLLISFFDVNTYSKSRKELYQELSQLAAHVNVDPNAVFAFLDIKSDAGNEVSSIRRFRVWAASSRWPRMSRFIFVSLDNRPFTSVRPGFGTVWWCHRLKARGLWKNGNLSWPRNLLIKLSTQTQACLHISPISSETLCQSNTFLDAKYSIVLKYNVHCYEDWGPFSSSPCWGVITAGDMFTANTSSLTPFPWYR